MRIKLALTLLLAGAATVWLGGCPGGDATTANPFLTLTEANLMASPSGAIDDNDDSVGQRGQSVDATFRTDITINFINHSGSHDLQFNFLAWVMPSSLQNDRQRDVLLDSGYVELQTEQRIGVAHRLPPGAFVYRGTGAGGVQRFFLGAADGRASDVIPETDSITITTPDAVLIFLDPPDSCDSTAFEFVDQGDTGNNIGLGYGTATGGGGRKTLAQIDVYQCDPFNPGLFLKSSGGTRQPNEYFEGEDFSVHFFQAAYVAVPGGYLADYRGDAAIVDFTNAVTFTVVDSAGDVDTPAADDEEEQSQEDEDPNDASAS